MGNVIGALSDSQARGFQKWSFTGFLYSVVKMLMLVFGIFWCDRQLYEEVHIARHTLEAWMEFRKSVYYIFNWQETKSIFLRVEEKMLIILGN